MRVELEASLGYVMKPSQKKKKKKKRNELPISRGLA
jgi:hypothetical protein